jgi:hypothetical protein
LAFVAWWWVVWALWVVAGAAGAAASGAVAAGAAGAIGAGAGVAEVWAKAGTAKANETTEARMTWRIAEILFVF